MKIDLGMAAVICAVLIFYLRLIMLQRVRAKENRRLALARQLKAAQKPAGGASKNSPRSTPSTSPVGGDSLFSSRPRDWVIAGIGLAAVLIGLLLYSGLLPLQAIRPYAWIPSAAGIILFSWAFQL